MKSYLDVIKELDLVPLPEEGGFYRETYRSSRQVKSPLLGEMSECTAIYYLITEDSFSALHVVDQDEIFHFYAGSPVEMLQIDEAGIPTRMVIGSDIFAGQIPQVVVRHGIWQGTKLLAPSPGSWALLGCTVAPGFELRNFHVKSRSELITMFPNLNDEIIQYTN
jgi:uncharacterized protein